VKSSSSRALLCVALLALAGLSGCLRLRFDRSTVDRPPPPAAFEFLGLPGVDEAGPARGQVERSAIAAGASLESCLNQLGAPLFVWARDLTGEQGFAAAWGWRRISGWGIVFAVPLGDAPSANLDYSESDRNLEGLVLFFDADWRLERADRAYLADVLPNVGLVGSFAN
jgi:hypothetical protein